MVDPITAELEQVVKYIVEEVERVGNNVVKNVVSEIKTNVEGLFKLPTTGSLVPLLNESAIHEFSHHATSVSSVENLKTHMSAHAGRPPLTKAPLVELLTSAESLLNETGTLIATQGVPGLNDLHQFAVNHLQGHRQNIENMGPSIEQIRIPPGICDFEGMNTTLKASTRVLSGINEASMSTTPAAAGTKPIVDKGTMTTLINVKAVLGGIADISMTLGYAFPIGLNVGVSGGFAFFVDAEAGASMLVVNLGTLLLCGIATVLYIIARVLDAIVANHLLYA